VHILERVSTIVQSDRHLEKYKSTDTVLRGRGYFEDNG